MLAGLLVGLAVAQAPTPAATPKPALWQVNGVHGTVYLFGTAHLLQKDVAWQTPTVRRALEASDTVYLEIRDLQIADLEKSAPELKSMVMAAGMDAEHPLSTRIPKEDVARLDTAIKGFGLPGEQAFEPMRPWLMSLLLSAMPAMQAGYTSVSGTDRLLDKEALAKGKTIKGFETVEEELHQLADMPEADQVAMLEQALDDLPQAQAQADRITADWSKGDVDAIATTVNDALKRRSPTLYDRLVVERNRHFTAEIAKLLEDPSSGSVFVAIGLGHLAGPDSVNAMLSAKGYKVQRIE